MKRLSFSLLGAVLLLALGSPVSAADAKAQLQELVEKVKAKIKAGNRTEAALGEEMKAFDALLAEHHGEKTDDVAQIVLMKAMLYLQVMDNEAKGKELLAQVKQDFPGTEPAKRVDSIIDQMARQSVAKKTQDGLKEGTPFPVFEEKDLDGKPLSVAAYKGKVLLVDFWATWCGPCVGELPNVKKAYEKYHSQGFEIVGISLDSDRNKLTAFIKDKEMPWPQYFDGQGWQNKLAAKYGVNSIPATYLLDKDGVIIGKGLRGEALDVALAKALK